LAYPPIKNLLACRVAVEAAVAIDATTETDLVIAVTAVKEEIMEMVETDTVKEAKGHQARR
jgi:hypothetical protein